MMKKRNKCNIEGKRWFFRNERYDNEESPEKKEVNTCVDDLSGDNDNEVSK